MKKILFISGSLGLGHVSRDLAIAKELRRYRADIDIRWLAAEPARSVIADAGEKLVDEVDNYNNDNNQAEATAQGTKLSLLKYAFKSLLTWLHNADVVKKIISNGQYDLVIGDETYEIIVALIAQRLKLDIPFIMLYDFLGLDATSKNPIEKIGAFFWNRIWSMDHKIFRNSSNIALFVGEPEDIPDLPFGIFLPNRRKYAEKYYQFIGYILDFEPRDYSDKAGLRKELGYGNETLIISSIGGTAIGKELLELCGKAFSIVKKQIPDIQMVLVCGPRLPADSLNVPEGIIIKQYVPHLYKHFACCDLAIVQAGGTTTLELSALQRPFIYFPIEGHSEQEIVVTGRLQRYQIGVKMSYSSTSAELLADKIVDTFNNYKVPKATPAQGAHNAVKIINRII